MPEKHPEVAPAPNNYQEEHPLGKYFGTDGIRGIAGEDLTAELAMAAAAAAARTLGASGGHVIVGEDTRASSDMLTSAIAAGLAAQGTDSWMAGVIPTPAIATLVAKNGAACGIVVSASHNPYEYNGIKLFGPDGYKLPDETEDEIEKELEAILAGRSKVSSGRGNIGKVVDYSEGQAVYEDFLVSACRKGLKGLKVVLDCANGAAFSIAPRAFRRLGAEVLVLNDGPDGHNINVRCGATDPSGMAKVAGMLGYDAGFAFDGDADRCIMSDEKGQVLDGDYEMLMLARAMKDEGLLGGDAIVATPYSNMGLGEALKDMGLRLLTAGNGDRYVLELMKKQKLNLGGEQSGHIVMLDVATTGDGILTAIRLASLIRSGGEPASKIAGRMRKYPQGQKALKVARKEDLEKAGTVWEEVRKIEKELAGKGRVFVRASGTEPVVRIMVEAAEQYMVDGMLERLTAVVEEALS